ncbi:Menaquinone reductase, integral membrane subunit [Pseudodesulfovibrio profundus]|uniref:Menaquinone reductase, integral membrane subunit n=1 Tax=Pseudodesulfovibrio profundus TaxID=57320 RepID=A0A2C8F7F6_9BACT|nr:menaquinone reductase integral membrane subunit QrcD [Pseudodesulfovibrio profundus]MBC17909.1 molybdopterin oxidoreductase [Desulfovibrio sp.]SOB57963.1 Menaquinone reductase, integral membrane subunit [Pseudodesulfovibrio profundus]|tara:strand:- start:5031 stop:6272 length:1242 start_codon:yes stop_codon:yes gene_type:complete
MDSKLFPEGVQRCGFGQYALWMAVITGVFLWGLYAAILVLYNGIGTTGLDNYFGFGAWITFDLAVIALGAGAFFTGLLKYILKIKQLEKIINLTVVVGFICYSGAMLVLTLDIGQPGRAWFGYWHPNVHSMLTEVIFCITCYCTVLIIEFIPLVLEQKQLNKIPFIHALAHNMHVNMALFAGIGAFLSTFHQGSLGGMYGVLIGRPFAFREGFFIWPWTFFLFVLSAVGSGPVFTVLVATFMEKLTGKKLVDYKTKALMAKIAGTMLCVYMFFKILDTWAWAYGYLPSVGLTFEEMFYGVAYGQWLLWTEIILCGVVPAIMLITPAIRNRPALMYTAAILDCIGVSLNRYIFTVQTIAFPSMPFDDWVVYYPNWVEYASSIMIVAYGFLVLSLVYRYLPLFPQERQLNYQSGE